MIKGLDCRLVLVVISVWQKSHFTNCDDDATMTTAVSFDATTPKPTAIYRRIIVDPHDVKEIERTPLDLFSFRAKELRRSKISSWPSSDIWKWDYWCQLQPKVGFGIKRLNRYYYDAQIDQCLPFEYSGNNGNKNNFQTLGDCERYCKGAAYMTIKDTDHSTFCALQPHAGLCMAMFKKYFYDVNEGRCKQFFYGGCGGNQNRFDSVAECMRRCDPEHDIIADISHHKKHTTKS